MWFKLAGATFSTHLGPMSKLSSSISIKYNANGFNYITGSVSKDDTSASLVLTLNNNYTYEHSDSNVTVTGATKGSISYASGTLTIPITPSSGSTFGASGASSINVTVTGAVSSGGEPEAPTNYTFTINPTPTSATVTLSATGYSTVSGTGSKSITVASGTNVTYEVSASGYITQSGSKSITRGEALSIVLNQSGTVDTWYTNYAIGPAKDGANIAKSNYAGFAYQGANDDNYIGVPINAVRLRVAQAGTMTIGIVNKSDLKTIVSSQTITLTNPSISNVQEYRLSEQITLTSGQLLMFGAQGDTGLFYYKESGTATPANGERMYNNLGTANAKRASSSASLTVDAGFLI